MPERKEEKRTRGHVALVVRESPEHVINLEAWALDYVREVRALMLRQAAPAVPLKKAS